MLSSLLHSLVHSGASLAIYPPTWRAEQSSKSPSPIALWANICLASIFSSSTESPRGRGKGMGRRETPKGKPILPWGHPLRGGDSSPLADAKHIPGRWGSRIESHSPEGQGI